VPNKAILIIAAFCYFNGIITVFSENLPINIFQDLLKTEEPVNVDFSVPKHGLYEVLMAFRYADHRTGLDAVKSLEAFTGTAQYHRVTDESAGTNTPVEVPEYTKEEEAFLAQGGSLVGGSYFKNRQLAPNQRWHEPPPNTKLIFTKAGAGTIIPVSIQVDKTNHAYPVVTHRRYPLIGS
jgi:hypothetical protein